MARKKEEQQEALWRILIFFISGIIITVWMYLAFILSLINVIYTLIKNSRHKEIAEFTEYFNTELYKFSRYISGISNQRPFPFSNVERMSKFTR